MRELTLKSAGVLEELGHRVEHVDEPPVPASFADDFVLYWGFLALAIVRTGRRAFGASFDRTRLDALTLGLDRHTGRNLHRLPLAIARLRRLRRRTAQFFATYDAVLMPTLADETPPVGYLAPTDYQQVIDRLIDWVAFTPLQNVTGEPAISLPLAQSADGMPVGMMLSADMGAGSAAAGAGLRTRRGQALGPNPGRPVAQSDPSFSSIRLNSRCCGRAQFGQDAAVGDADRGLRALQQRAALAGQRGRQCTPRRHRRGPCHRANLFQLAQHRVHRLRV